MSVWFPEEPGWFKKSKKKHPVAHFLISCEGITLFAILILGNSLDQETIDSMQPWCLILVIFFLVFFLASFIAYAIEDEKVEKNKK
jgi:hypothetical protein